MAISSAQIGFRAESGAFGSGSVVRLEITNWNEIMKTLRGLDKKYVQDLRKEFRSIAKPVQDKVRRAIPSKAKPPLSGMKQVHFGRLAWGSTYGAKAKPAKSVIIQTPNTRSKTYAKVNEIPIVRLQVQSPGTVLYDMAGRLNGVKGRKGFTPWYDYMYHSNGRSWQGKRRHRVVPNNFLSSLTRSTGYQKPQASRIIWPAAERAMPEATRKMDAVITKTNLKINQMLKVS